MKKKIIFLSVFLTSAFVLAYAFLAFSQPPVKPMERPPIQELQPAPTPKPQLPKRPDMYYPHRPCEGEIEVIQPVTIKYPGRYGEETTITLNKMERKVIQIPENLFPAELKVTYRLKNKTNKHLRLDNLWIEYGNRGGAYPLLPLNFAPHEQKNIEQKIIVNEGSREQYLYFRIGGPTGCSEDTPMIFFNAYLMIYVIVL